MPSGPSIIWGPSSPPPLQCTISDLLTARCTAQPDTLAIAAPQENCEWLWSDLRDRVHGLASGLAVLGLSKGHRLGVMLGNRSEYLEARVPTVSTAHGFSADWLDRSSSPELSSELT